MSRSTRTQIVVNFNKIVFSTCCRSHVL